MQLRVVTDSSANISTLPGISFASVPLSVYVGDEEFVDDAACDVDTLLARLQSNKGRTTTSCPAPQLWQEAFDGAEYVICMTITSKMSGTYNTAMIAAREYEEEHPGCRCYVMDTLSTGPEMGLLAQKLAELAQTELDFDGVVAAIEAYRQKTHLVFILESLRSLVSNGRVSHAVGALAGLLGLRFVCCGSDKGELQPLTKCRGSKKAMAELQNAMQRLGWQGGRVRIDHVNNEEGAKALKSALLALHEGADIVISRCRALCTYYAENGGLLVGFET